MQRFTAYLVAISLLVIVQFHTTLTQDEIKRPTFPNVFQVEVQGIFKDQLVEADGVIYYDQSNNRAALFVDYQNESSKTMYFFADNEMVSIQGYECTVETLPDNADFSFFPFTTDEKTKEKKIASPEEVLYFSKSAFVGEEVSLYPSYIYKATIDIPQYSRKNCDITHVFSKPEVETPTCEGHTCQPTLVAISVQCPKENENEAMDHSYAFYRFRSGIKDERVFQSPPGVHCSRKNKKPFPPPPPFLSFSYDITEKMIDHGTEILTVNSHKKVWYDSTTKLVRIDEYNDKGLLSSTKIFDYKNGAAYTILTINTDCDTGTLVPDLTIDRITGLPDILFSHDPSNSEKAVVYVGKRKVHELDYEVWSLFSKDENELYTYVKEIYFSKFVPNNEDVVGEPVLQLSYIEVYGYDKDNDLKVELIMTTYISINNFRTFPKDWSQFDVATCFTADQKAEFELKMSGEDVLQNSEIYSSILFILYQKLVEISGISVIRISELRGIFDSNRNLTAFRGLILENPMELDVGNKNTELSIKAAYKKIETEILKGDFYINITEKEKLKKYHVNSIKLLQGEKDEIKRPTFPNVFQVEVQGIFKDQLVEADGVIYYDKLNNRAALFVDYQNESFKTMYFFDDNEMVSIEGYKCTVETLPDNADFSFFPFTIDEKTKEKKIASPEKILRFLESVYVGEELSLYPSYIYKASIDIPQYKRKNCDITHVFSKPEVETPTCEGHACQPTLVAISVQCPKENENEAMDHSYAFYRFRSGIKDERLFQSPPGVHCSRKNKKPFPPPPPFLSFSYDITEKMIDHGTEIITVNAHKKVWYDSTTKLVRIDEYDDKELLSSTKIFDYNNGAAYTILMINTDCDTGPLSPDLTIDRLTGLPDILFSNSPSNSEKAVVYVGKRKVHELDYEVWSLLSEDENELYTYVKEIYFTRFVPNNEEIVGKTQLQLSYLEIYGYDKDNGLKVELIMTTYISINNFRTFPTDWSQFDVATCFTANQKAEFELKISGEDVLQNSEVYSSILLKLYQKLVEISGISVIRISELRGIFDSNRNLTAFRGLILENPMEIDVGTNNTELSINAAYKKIETEISKGNFYISITEKEELKKYHVNSIKLLQEEKNENVRNSGDEKVSYSGASLAAAAIIMMLLGTMLGAVGYYVYLKRRKFDDTIQLEPLSLH